MSNYFLSKDKNYGHSSSRRGFKYSFNRAKTGIHRDPIMRLGVKIGQGCGRLLDQKMQNSIASDWSWTKLADLLARKCVTSKRVTIQLTATFEHIARLTLKLIPSYHVPSSRDIENTTNLHR